MKLLFAIFISFAFADMPPTLSSGDKPYHGPFQDEARAFSDAHFSDKKMQSAGVRFYNWVEDTKFNDKVEADIRAGRAHMFEEPRDLNLKDENLKRQLEEKNASINLLGWVPYIGSIDADPLKIKEHHPGADPEVMIPRDRMQSAQVSVLACFRDSNCRYREQAKKIMKDYYPELKPDGSLLDEPQTRVSEGVKTNSKALEDTNGKIAKLEEKTRSNSDASANAQRTANNALQTAGSAKEGARSANDRAAVAETKADATSAEIEKLGSKLLSDFKPLLDEIEERKLQNAAQRTREEYNEYAKSAGNLSLIAYRVGNPELGRALGAVSETMRNVGDLRAIKQLYAGKAMDFMGGLQSANIYLSMGMTLVSLLQNNEEAGNPFPILFAQLKQIARQIEDLRREMHNRFDGIERMLDGFYDRTMINFNDLKASQTYIMSLIRKGIIENRKVGLDLNEGFANLSMETNKSFFFRCEESREFSEDNIHECLSRFATSALVSSDNTKHIDPLKSGSAVKVGKLDLDKLVAIPGNDRPVDHDSPSHLRDIYFSRLSSTWEFWVGHVLKTLDKHPEYKNYLFSLSVVPSEEDSFTGGISNPDRKRAIGDILIERGDYLDNLRESFLVGRKKDGAYFLKTGVLINFLDQYQHQVKQWIHEAVAEATLTKTKNEVLGIHENPETKEPDSRTLNANSGRLGFTKNLRTCEHYERRGYKTYETIEKVISINKFAIAKKFEGMPMSWWFENENLELGEFKLPRVLLSKLPRGLVWIANERDDISLTPCLRSFKVTNVTYGDPDSARLEADYFVQIDFMNESNFSNGRVINVNDRLARLKFKLHRIIHCKDYVKSDRDSISLGCSYALNGLSYPAENDGPDHWQNPIDVVAESPSDYEALLKQFRATRDDRNQNLFRSLVTREYENRKQSEDDGRLLYLALLVGLDQTDSQTSQLTEVFKAKPDNFGMLNDRPTGNLGAAVPRLLGGKLEIQKAVLNGYDESQIMDVIAVRRKIAEKLIEKLAALPTLRPNIDRHHFNLKLKEFKKSVLRANSQSI